MVVRVKSVGVLGVQGFPVDVEVDVSRGLPSFTVVGLPDSAVKESRERVRAALVNSGFEFPSSKITVNLSPADVKKEGSSFDLPMALGLLAAKGFIPRESLEGFYFLGELSLDGSLVRTRGALSAALFLKGKSSSLILPSSSGGEASLVEDVEVLGAENLSQVVSFLKGEGSLKRFKVEDISQDPEYPVDFSEVKGQERIRRAVEVAASGGHNLFMVGPPGAGKTMIAQRIPTILPPLSRDELIETTAIYSVAGLLGDKPYMSQRPFVSPHHTSSEVGIIGGGQVPRPGAVSLAHNGVLFLDELPEFKRSVLEALRQPLEDGVVTITRASTTVTFPARFMLVAASNPCPCGYYGFEGKKVCTCTYSQVRKYRSKLSGPLMDRIDIHLEVPPLEAEELLEEGSGEPSSKIRERVKKVRDVQVKRQGKLNAHLGGSEVRRFCRLGVKEKALLKGAVEKLGLSARSFTRILKVARTIADMEESEPVKSSHISEAIQYRILERLG